MHNISKPEPTPHDQDQDRPSFGDRLRYYVDLFMSWSPAARFIGLFGLSFALVALCAAFAMVFSPADAAQTGDFLEAMWWAMTRVADAGTMGDDSGLVVRTIAVCATLAGILVVALLIGLVSSTLGEKIEDLRKGKSPVIDSGHTLILGFGEKVYPILRELREANASLRSATVVILDTQDKTEIEEAIRARMDDMGTTRIVVRQGSPFSLHDLRKVGAGRARSIIVVASDDAADGAHADMGAIKTLLALRRVPGALTRNHAVVELIESDRVSVLQKLGDGGVEVVSMRETLARLMVQTARQSGLAQVYKGLLSYEGSELYFRCFPELSGRQFGEVQLVLKDDLLERDADVGVRKVLPAGQGQVFLNPPLDMYLEAQDELLVLAEDDDSFRVDISQPHRLEPSTWEPSSLTESKTAERVLVCGFRSDLARLLAEFDQYVAPGSEMVLMPGDSHVAACENLLAARSRDNHLAVTLASGDATHPDHLRQALHLGFDAILLVADDTIDPQEADARTVISLLLLRDLVDVLGLKAPRLISEILDPRTQELVTADSMTDFVVSSEITSMLLAQISERRELNAVFADLFDSDGNEIYMKHASRYAPLGTPVSWLAIQRMAAQYGEVAIGCFRPGVDPYLNPKQTLMLQLGESDRIVVIAPDDGEAVLTVKSLAA